MLGYHRRRSQQTAGVRLWKTWKWASLKAADFPTAASSTETIKPAVCVRLRPDNRERSSSCLHQCGLQKTHSTLFRHYAQKHLRNKHVTCSSHSCSKLTSFPLVWPFPWWLESVQHEWELPGSGSRVDRGFHFFFFLPTYFPDTNHEVQRVWTAGDLNICRSKKTKTKCIIRRPQKNTSRAICWKL